MLSNPSISTPESGFTPRREFIREQKPVPNSFSLLAISSSNCIRLYSFPLAFVNALRRFFEQRSLITNFREDIPNNFCEFALDGKPWASAKSIATENLLVDILSIIYQHGYSYLSTIDYGRESDDRLAMTFFKPGAQPSSRSDSPIPPSLAAEGSKITLSDKSRVKRIPFALSFPSATLLRVICPPLHSTPAILQAVRGSWPRGVVSEKKVGDRCFEFKLKGYKWFQEDTFATDSLRHILSLLTSLDTHSFSLLTSISLTNRSRVKDLWIFTGPVASTEDLSLPDSPAPSILNSTHDQYKRVAHSPPELPPYNSYSSSPQNQHRRLATEPSRPANSPPSPLPHQHARAATEDAQMMGLGHHQHDRSSNTLRKPAPRAQLPVSVHDADREAYRANLPSTVSEDVENMTGIGAGAAARTPDIFYATSPFGSVDAHGRTSPPASFVVDATNGSRPATPARGGGGTPPHAIPIMLGAVDASRSTSPARSGGSPPSASPFVTVGAVNGSRSASPARNGGVHPSPAPFVTVGAVNGSRPNSPSRNGGAHPSSSPFVTVGAVSGSRPSSPAHSGETPPNLRSSPDLHIQTMAAIPAHHESAPQRPPPSAYVSDSSAQSGPVTPGTPQELLGPGVFRDSALSTSTDMSAEIPIKWTGGMERETWVDHDDGAPAVQRESLATPMFPGGWQPTPIEEKPEHTHPEHHHGEALTIILDQDKHPEQPLHELNDRVASPEITSPQTVRRQSEAGVLGHMPDPEPPSSKGKEKEGWVLVNVEGQSASSPEPGAEGEQRQGSSNSGTTQVLSQSPEPLSPSSPATTRLAESSPILGPPIGQQPSNPQGTMSPAAKAIVILDAVDQKQQAKSKKNKSGSSSRIKRFFSLSKKDSKQDSADASSATDSQKAKKQIKRKSGLAYQDPNIRNDTLEATRNGGKRRSIDG